MHWRRGEGGDGGGGVNPVTLSGGALRCGERIIQNPEYE